MDMKINNTHTDIQVGQIVKFGHMGLNEFGCVTEVTNGKRCMVTLRVKTYGNSKGYYEQTFTLRKDGNFVAMGWAMDEGKRFANPTPAPAVPTEEEALAAQIEVTRGVVDKGFVDNEDGKFSDMNPSDMVHRIVALRSTLLDLTEMDAKDEAFMHKRLVIAMGRLRDANEELKAVERICAKLELEAVDQLFKEEMDEKEPELTERQKAMLKEIQEGENDGIGMGYSEFDGVGLTPEEKGVLGSLVAEGYVYNSATGWEDSEAMYCSTQKAPRLIEKKSRDAQ